MEDKSKKITLNTVAYKRIEQGFKSWLATLGYAQSSVYGLPRRIREFLSWLEQEQITSIHTVSQSQTKAFIAQFKNRPHQRQTGGLSISYVNKQIHTLNLFFKYLHTTGQYEQNISHNKLKEAEIKKREILTKQEIAQLYQATDNNLIGMRDRAMLGIYYGCGLRKSEGLSLEVSDVLFERRLLYVRHTKNNHERYVPINLKVLQDLETYIYQARPLQLNETVNNPYLFISEQGKALKGASMISRLKTLQAKTGNPELENRPFGLHALRHSIATHLLQAGMELENIALFLGHKTLDSTQLYTHLIND